MGSGYIFGGQGPRVSHFSWGIGSLWQGLRQCRETCTVPVPWQAGAEQQGSNLDLQLQGLTPDFFLQSRMNWAQPWWLCALLVSHSWQWLCLPGQSWAGLALTWENCRLLQCEPVFHAVLRTDCHLSNTWLWLVQTSSCGFLTAPFFHEDLSFLSLSCDAAPFLAHTIIKVGKGLQNHWVQALTQHCHGPTKPSPQMPHPHFFCPQKGGMVSH